MLKCLQVTGLKVGVQGWGCGAGKRENLEKRAWNKKMKAKSKAPHVSPTCGPRQILLRIYRPGHPPCFFQNTAGPAAYFLMSAFSTLFIAARLPAVMAFRSRVY